MSLTAIILIYSVVGTVAFISIFLGIINWINLASTSSSINELQAEIEKKCRVIDSHKKEMVESNNSTISPINDALQGTKENFSYPHQQPKSAEKDMQIEVVRNIRNGFVDNGSPHLTQETVNMNKFNVTDSEKQGEQNINQQWLNIPAPPKDTIGANIPQDNREVLATVKEQVTDAPSQISKKNTITIPLYSQAGKDADFNNLWKTICKAMESTKQVHVNIDFKNILFLYEKEIEYLKKINEIVLQQKGTMRFFNCSSELIAFLWEKDKDLAHLIQDL